MIYGLSDQKKMCSVLINLILNELPDHFNLSFFRKAQGR